MEGTLVDDYRLTVTLSATYGAPEELEEAAARLLESLVADRADLGPITDADLREGTLSATIAYDASGLGLDDAIRHGTEIIGKALTKARVETGEVVDAHLTRVTDRNLQPA